ncbi:Angiotensin-converting enzyme [Nymphon striatum]|nr:Angiotensin-converting enzyme [Nymphon striatum]
MCIEFPNVTEAPTDFIKVSGDLTMEQDILKSVQMEAVRIFYPFEDPPESSPNLTGINGSTHDKVKRAGETFVLKRYGASSFESLDKYRHIAYKREIWRCSPSSSFQLASLPPTSAAAKKHSYRNYHTVQEWMGNTLPPIEWGWRSHDGTLAPVETDRPVAPESLLNMLEVGEESAKFSLRKQEQVVEFDWSNFKNESIKRQLEFQSLKGMAALPKEKYSELQKIQSKMSGVYGKGKMSSFDGKKHDLRLDPDLTKIMGTSNDYERLSHAWKGWRDAVGKPIRQDYIQYVNLKNEASIFINLFLSLTPDFTDYSKYLIRNYESDTFVEDIEGLWLELKPLYEELHAFVRRKLRDQYGADKIKERGTIPAHILGNMWAQSWTNIFKFVTPYPKKQAIDVTEALVSKGYDALKMFKLSEDFFTGLGLEPMTKEFWSNSIITKPPGREMVCHGSAWDFGDKKDFRVKMCTVVTMVDLITVHHEMGHTQYYIQYANQPLIFREGANSGFHEAIGDTLALSVMTPEHLHKIGLLDSVVNDDETDINFLMNMALEKIAFLPFAYMMDRYRWDIFKGEIEFKNMNQRWWELREMYQGVSPPVERSENDFDPGAKYHIPNGVPYVRYFVSFIIQFQFHEALCRIAGHSGPLHRCDISGTNRAKDAGRALAEIMQMGNSRPWPEAMKKLTGQPKMSASSVMKYFKPLHDWLRKQNKGHKVGWILPSKENASKCPLKFFGYLYNIAKELKLMKS